MTMKENSLDDKGYATASFVFLVIDMILLSAIAILSWSVGIFLMPTILKFREEIGGENPEFLYWFSNLRTDWGILVFITCLLLVWKKRWLGSKRVKLDLGINIGFLVALVALVLFCAFVNIILVYDTFRLGLQP